MTEPATANTGSLPLSLLVRLFTASNGRPDEAEPDSTAGNPVWLSRVATRQSFEERLDLAAEIGATQIEITQFSQLSGAQYLLENAAARKSFQDGLRRRGLDIAALNCSGMPLHPAHSRASQQLIRQTIRLAEQLGVKKIVTMSGTSGDGADATTINWIFFPWPQESVALFNKQWDAATALWRDLADFASDHGVEQIALELHPLHLVYNVPTLLRMREAVGPIIGANVDPSHLVWQQMDPVAVVRALGAAVQHVHLKDTELIHEQVAIAGVLDDRTFSDPRQRAWIQRTIGRGHNADFWSAFISALLEVGYQGAVSIENEDPFQTYEEGVREAAAFLQPLLAF
jgi:sugar phosphate isomerase/epimerase